MDQQLTGRDFLAGDFTFADIGFFMASLFGEVLGATMGPDNGRLLDWRSRIGNRTSVREVVGPMISYMGAVGLVDDQFAGRVLSWNGQAE